MTDPPRALVAIPGVWTDAWFDAPDAWWAWACHWAGWSIDDWHRFRAAWGRSSDARREALSRVTGIHFLDWRVVPGGSIRGVVADGVRLLRGRLDALPAGTTVTLLGHSKGGNVIKHLLADASRTTGATVDPPRGGVIPAHAVLLDAPVDPVREVACAALGLGIRPVHWRGSPAGLRMATVNNWYDPSGGRLAGVPNYQVRVWNDRFVPWPPHGMKSFLARRVLGDLGALPPAGAARTPTDLPSTAAG